MDETSLGSEAVQLSRVLRDGDNLYLAAWICRPYGEYDPHIFMIDGNGTIAKNEALNQNAKGEPIEELLGLIPSANALYAYYVTKDEPAIVFRDRVDKSTLLLQGDQVMVLKGNEGQRNSTLSFRVRTDINDYFVGGRDVRFIGETLYFATGFSVTWCLILRSLRLREQQSLRETETLPSVMQVLNSLQDLYLK